MTFPTSEVRVDRTLRVPVVISPTVFSGFDLVLEEHTMFTASCVGEGLWIGVKMGSWLRSHSYYNCELEQFHYQGKY